MIVDESEQMRQLRQLDEATGWVESGDLLAANDTPDDDGMAGVLAFPHLHPIDGGAEAESDSLDRGPTPTEIIDTAQGMVENGIVEDILVIINTPDGEQHLMTTLNRNDHIIGMLSVATMNWHSSQIAASNWREEEEG